MRSRKTRGKSKTTRFRSNVYHPKVHRPITFELTKDGIKQLKATRAATKKSIGDIVENLILKHGPALTEADFPAAIELDV